MFSRLYRYWTWILLTILLANEDRVFKKYTVKLIYLLLQAIALKSILVENKRWVIIKILKCLGILCLTPLWQTTLPRGVRSSYDTRNIYNCVPTRYICRRKCYKSFIYFMISQNNNLITQQKNKYVCVVVGICLEYFLFCKFFLMVKNKALCLTLCFLRYCQY